MARTDPCRAASPLHVSVAEVKVLRRRVQDRPELNLGVQGRWCLQLQVLLCNFPRFAIEERDWSLFALILGSEPREFLAVQFKLPSHTRLESWHRCSTSIDVLC